MASGPAGKDRPINVYQKLTVAQKSPFDLEKLQDKFKWRDTGWSIPEAFIGILILAGKADGTIVDVELEAIRQIANRSRCISSLPEDEQIRANNAAIHRLNELPEDQALAEACATLPADMCLSVFAHCVDIILSDGQLLDQESAFLSKVAKLLDIDENSERRVMEVLTLKALY